MSKMDKYFKTDKQMPVLPDDGLRADMVQNLASAKPGIPLVIEKAFDGTAAEVSIFDADCPFKLKVLDMLVQITTAGAAAAAVTAKIDDGTDDISNAVEVNAAGGTKAAGSILRATSIDPTKATLDAGDTLDITLSTTTNAPAGVVRVTAVPVA